MDGITVEIDISQFLAYAEDLKKNLPRITQRIVQTLAEFTEGRMSLRSPVDTSFLRSSIETFFPSMNEAFVAPTADYAIWVELTWKKRNYGGFHIPSTEGFVADSYQDTIYEVERIVTEILNEET